MEWINMIDYDLAQAISMTILHSLWQGALFLGISLLIINSGLVTNASGKYYTHLLSLLFIALTAVATFCFLMAGGETLKAGQIGVGSEINLLWEVSTGSKSISWQIILTTIWLVGTILSLIRACYGLVSLQFQLQQANPVSDQWNEMTNRLRKLVGLRKAVRLLESHLVSSPFVFGIWRPVIIFPSVYFLQLTPRQVESLLLHELAHISRNDFIINLIQVVIESVLFLNPAVWYLSAEVRRYREYQCDDEVQSLMGDPAIYLMALFQISQIKARQPSLAIHLFHNQSQLLKRMKRMLNNTPERARVRSVISGLFVFLLLITGLAITTLFGRDQLYHDGETIEESIGLRAMREADGMNLPFLNLEKFEESNESTDSCVPGIEDTIPPSPRMREIEKQLELKAAELEQLAKQFEQEMGRNLTTDLASIEELSEKLEQLSGDKMENIEDKYSAQMERMEEVAAQLEVQMKDLNREMESLNEDVLEQLADQLEMKALEFEYLDSLPPADSEKLQKEMQELQRQMEEEMHTFHELHQQLQNNPEIRKLQDEMRVLQKQLQPMHEEHRNLWNEEMKSLHEQLNKMQGEIREKMQGFNQEWHEQMRFKSGEIRQLHEQLRMEMENLRNEQNKNN